MSGWHIPCLMGGEAKGAQDMDVRSGSMMRYIWGILGLIGILTVAIWLFGRAPSFDEGPAAQDCMTCDRNVCPATAESWRKLFNKIFDGNDP